MITIKYKLKLLRALVAILAAIILLVHFWYWLFPDTFHLIGIPNSAIEEHGGVKSLSLAERWSGFFITLLPRIAIIYALFNLFRLTDLLLVGEWFAEECEKRCILIGRMLFLYVCLNIVHGTLLVGLLTIGNPPGERLFAIGFSSEDLIAIVLAFFALIIGHIVGLARQQRDELNEIV